MLGCCLWQSAERQHSLGGDGDAVGLEEALCAVKALGGELVVAERPQQLAHLQRRGNTKMGILGRQRATEQQR